MGPLRFRAGAAELGVNRRPSEPRDFTIAQLDPDGPQNSKLLRDSQGANSMGTRTPCSRLTMAFPENVELRIKPRNRLQFGSQNITSTEGNTLS